MRPRMKGLLLGSIGAAAAIVCYARFVELARVQLDRFTVPVDKRGIPPQGLTILHLSDLHLRESGAIQARKLDSLRRALADAQYDLVALTGDLIHDQPGLATALSFIGELQPRLGGFSCLGNHDYWESSLWGIFGKRADDAGPWRRADVIEAARTLWAFVGKVIRNERVYARVAAHDVPAMNAGLHSLGVQALVNASTHLRAGKIDLWIAGVDDLGQGSPDLQQALLDVPLGAPLLLLAHNPDIWLEAGVERADLVLSGHTHGGQVRLPLLGSIHTQGTYLPRRHAAGWFQRGSTRMFVTRGVGESLPLRMGASPQAALIRLVPVEPHG
ncbi:MAG: metallophosphoesterase [Anaerolineae bacterium]|nr:metallophosphoesterase [Anaerolineae bacterium]